MGHVPANREGEAAEGWRQLGADDLVDALRADPDVRAGLELVQVVHELASGRDEIPPSLRPALGRALGVPDSYFDDQSVADREDARRLPGLLRDIGVTGAHLCRCPPVAETRVRIWTALLEVAREHTRADHPVAGGDDY